MTTDWSVETKRKKWCCMPSPLSGVTVVEVDGDLPIQFCGRALADLGATVTKVEPVGGDPLRREPPLIEDGTSSAVFESVNRRKRCVVVDGARLEQLVAACDVAISAAGGRATGSLRPREVVAELEAVVRARNSDADWLRARAGASVSLADAVRDACRRFSE